MRKVNNKKSIQKLAWRTMKNAKGRNVIAILAIVLTAVMFTSVFTIGGSLVNKQQQETMRQVGGSAHGGFKYLTQEEYDTVKKDKKLKEVTYRTIVGDAVNDSLKKLHTEMSYYEPLAAKLGFCYPEKGRMPEKEDEIVTSDLVLEAMGIPREIGQKVPVKLQIGSRVIEKTFTLSGYFKGDIVSMAQIMMVSETFAKKEAPTPTDSIQDIGISADQYPGRIVVDYNFYSSFNLEKQQDELVKRCGFTDAVPTGLNWAYLADTVDPSTLVLVVVVLGVILLSGYLIIYNLFYIHVYQDIRHYGLLKTIGTTGRQLRKIVRRQTYLLALAGIPLGMLGGVLVGKVLLPVVMKNLVFIEGTDSEVSLNIWIFTASALFTFVTVYISSIRPCKTASSVSPMEAIRFTEGKSGKKTKAGKKRTHRVKPINMALANIKRNKKKAVLVILSISLGLILLNSVVGLVQGFDMEKFVASASVSDFSVTDASLGNISSMEKVLDGVTPGALEGLKEQKGITELGNVYLMPGEFSMDEAAVAQFQERIMENPDLDAYFSKWNSGVEGYVESMWEQKQIDSKIYGIGDMLLPKLELYDGKLDLEKFKSGNYVIINRIGGMDDSEPVEFYHVGEKLTLTGANGTQKEYEVLAVAEFPYAASLQQYGLFDCTFVLPETEFLSLEGARQPMRTLVNVEPKYRKNMEAWLENYTTKVNSDLYYTSRGTLEAQFGSMKNMYTMVGGLLAFILALIGILNFVNTMVTSIYARKKEFAMMEAVGLTKKQMKQTLCWEGTFYAVCTAIVSLILGGLLNGLVIRKLGEAFFFFTWQFTVTPILLCVPVLLLATLLIPLAACKKMRQESVVLRMRDGE